MSKEKGLFLLFRIRGSEKAEVAQAFKGAAIFRTVAAWAKVPGAAILFKIHGTARHGVPQDTKR